MSDQFATDFLRGQRDCKEGFRARPDDSVEYMRGYAAQYELEQVQAEMTKND